MGRRLASPTRMASTRGGTVPAKGKFSPSVWSPLKGIRSRPTPTRTPGKPRLSTPQRKSGGGLPGHSSATAAQLPLLRAHGVPATPIKVLGKRVGKTGETGDAIVHVSGVPGTKFTAQAGKLRLVGATFSEEQRIAHTKAVEEVEVSPFGRNGEPPQGAS